MLWSIAADAVVTRNRWSRPARIAALAVTAVAATAGCGRSDADLEVLRRQTMATAEVPGTERGTTSEVTSGTSLSKTRYAKLQRRLPLQPGTDSDTVLQAAVQLAQDDGWTVEGEPSPSIRAWVLGRTVDGQRLDLGMSVQTIDGRPTLVMTLTNFR